MENSSIVQSFYVACRALYSFLVETLPNLLNTFSRPMIDVINETPVLKSIYDVVIVLAPDHLEQYIDLYFSAHSFITMFVGGTFALIITISIVRAIIKLFIGVF